MSAYTDRLLVHYRLPDGSIVQVDDSAAKGASAIDYTLKGGAIVQAARVYTPTSWPWSINTAGGRIPVVRELKQPHGEASLYVSSIQGVDGEHVCRLDFGYGKHGTDEVNARLIAAAPELLAVLKQVHACATLRDDGTCDGCLVSAAIAKAEGRS